MSGSRERELLERLREAHDIIAEMRGLIGPEEHPTLDARALAILVPCDEANHCPTIPATPAPVTPEKGPCVCGHVRPEHSPMYGICGSCPCFHFRAAYPKEEKPR